MGLVGAVVVVEDVVVVEGVEIISTGSALNAFIL